MNDHTITAVVSVILAIIGVGVLAVLVSKYSQTGAVFGSAATGLSNALCTALSPITGGKCIEDVTSIFRPIPGFLP